MDDSQPRRRWRKQRGNTRRGGVCGISSADNGDLFSQRRNGGVSFERLGAPGVSL